jgi:hypothetical protein
LNKRHEQSVIDGFFNYFQRVAASSQRKLVRCSMDGQDAIYGADYVFTDNSRFVLAEFKYEERNLVSEGEKPRRLKLCSLLDGDEMRRKQSMLCHYIAWSTARHSKRLVDFNRYYPEICNKAIFGDGADLLEMEADKHSRKQADALIGEFLSQNIGATYYTFKKYTEWLYAIEADGEGTMELMLDNPDSQQLELIDFRSLQDMKLWLDRHKPSPQFDPTSSFGP